MSSVGGNVRYVGGEISLIYCCIAQHPKLSSLKQQTFYLAHNSVGLQSGLGSARQPTLCSHYSLLTPMSGASAKVSAAPGSSLCLVAHPPAG